VSASAQARTAPSKKVPGLMADCRCTLAIVTATLFAMVVLSEPARCGTTGVVSGYVLYRRALAGSDALVPAPHVDVRLIGDDGVTIAKTDKSGFFSFVSVSPGLYNVLPGRYGPGCFPLVQASADQVTAVRVVMYTTQSINQDCASRDVVQAPGETPS
jgi:hypothetical protein